jgi:hypothetical protein
VISQTLIIDRKKYAVGLFWQPVSAGHQAKDVAAKIAHNAIAAKFKYFAEYRNFVALGSDELKHRVGLPVLAPEIIEAFADSPSFIAAFRVQNGFWIIGCRGGIILADSDHFYEDEAAAKSAYIKLLDMPDWNLRVAPDSWELKNTTERELSDLISGKVKCVLKRISNAGHLFTTSAIIAAILGVIFFSFEEEINNFAKNYKPHNKVELNQAAIEKYKAELAAKQLAEGKTPTVATKIEMPWEKIPNANDVAHQCLNAIAFIMQPIYGWNVVSAECSSEKIYALVRRDYGTVEDLYAVAESLMPGIDIKVSGTAGDNAELSGKIVKLPANSEVPTLTVAEIDNQVRSIFQQVNMPVSTEIVKERLEDKNAKTNVEYVRVVANSKIKPEDFIKFFDGIPAIELVSVKWDNSKNEWNYEEKIYAK